jgi:hypothetical protein
MSGYTVTLFIERPNPDALGGADGASIQFFVATDSPDAAAATAAFRAGGMLRDGVRLLQTNVQDQSKPIPSDHRELVTP